jgi:acetate---CoA ligase (ADP-forming)
MVCRGVELIVGGKRDQQTGPIIMLGVGGIFVELLDDVAFARVPISPDRARELAGNLNSQKLLDGFRGSEPVSRQLLGDLVERVAAVLVSHPEIAELDLNPVIAAGDRLVVADAAVVVSNDHVPEGP